MSNAELSTSQRKQSSGFQGLGLGRMGSYYLTGEQLVWEDENFWRWVVRMVAQLYECT